jgi:hypothetical protein
MGIDKDGILTVTGSAEGTDIKQVCMYVCIYVYDIHTCIHIKYGGYRHQAGTWNMHT